MITPLSGQLGPLTLTRRRLTAAFAPSSIAGLQLDLDPSALVLSGGDPVGLCPDQSGNGRDATAAGSARPTFLATPVNGLPALSFDGSDDFMAFGPFSLPAGFTLSVVIETTDSGGGGANYLPKVPVLNDAGSFLDFGVGAVGGGGNTQCYSGTGSAAGSGTYADGAYHHVLATHGLSGTLSLYLDGTADGSASVLYDAVNASLRYLGRNYAGNNFGNVRVARVLAYDSALTAPDRAALNAYAQSRYGTP